MAASAFFAALAAPGEWPEQAWPMAVPGCVNVNVHFHGTWHDLADSLAGQARTIPCRNAAFGPSGGPWSEYTSCTDPLSRTVPSGACLDNRHVGSMLV